MVPKGTMKNPGPGAYTIGPTLTPEGKYFLSKIKSPPVHSFNPPHAHSAFAKGFSNKKNKKKN